MLSNVRTDSRKRTAIRLTWISAVSFLIGGSWAWYLVSKGGPEALGAIIPMVAVGAIHLLLGPVAVLNAFKARQFKGKKFIYSYFVFYFLATTVMLHGEALAYPALFLVAVVIPLLLAVVASLIGDIKGR